MMAQIPLPWQLTDFLCALGLGFLCGGAYDLLRGAVRQLLRVAGRRGRRRAWRPATHAGRFVADALWAAGCALLLRAWVLTGSHAAQLRWSMVLAAVAGCGLFFLTAAPLLRQLAAALRRVTAALRRFVWRLLAPPLRFFGRQWRRLRRLRLPGREVRRRAWERRDTASRQAAAARAQRLQQKKAARLQKKSPPAEKNPQKELQTPRRMYYNNL